MSGAGRPDMRTPSTLPVRGANGDVMVSFGLLDDKDERNEVPFPFLSLFGRVRAAFAGPGTRRVPSRSSARTPVNDEERRRGKQPSNQPIVPLRTVAPSSTALAAIAPTVAVAREDESSIMMDDENESQSQSQIDISTIGVQHVPGFPLSREVLDDARSIISTSTRLRSDFADDSVSIASMAQPNGSVDEWIRRFRGEGLSRKYWMADETVKECRECLMPFTRLRRRHHCRICGQIFCSRCASNIVSARRFGQSGDIRVCNQCMNMLAEYDRREQIDAPHKQARARRRRGSEVSTMVLSPEPEPELEPDIREEPELEPIEETAPFRPQLEPEDAAEPSEQDGPFVPPAPTQLPPPDEVAAPKDGEVFNLGDAETQRVPDARAMPRTCASPARTPRIDAAQRRAAGAVLSAASMVHFSRMLQQLLENGRIGNVREWHDVIRVLALSVVDHIRLHPRESSLTDIRSSVKIKCVPGGQISDCEYIDGFVCSKNVATKRMAASLPLKNARVMVISFPLEYHRNARLLSLEPIIAQEHEFLRILVARIVALRPNVVIAEKSVSYLALRMFEKAGVLVFWSMKRRTVESIARCTQADIISSIDRLALDPRIGRCVSLDVDTYQQMHKGTARRKPLLKIEVARRDVGSALVLRGGTFDLLHRVKAVLTLMVFVGYNLRLEEYLRRDSAAVLDWAAIREQRLVSHNTDGSDEFSKFLRRFQGSILSSSISVVIPAPFLVERISYTMDTIKKLSAQCGQNRADQRYVHSEPTQEPELDTRAGAESSAGSPDTTVAPDSPIHAVSESLQLPQLPQQLQQSLQQSLQPQSAPDTVAVGPAAPEQPVQSVQSVAELELREPESLRIVSHLAQTQRYQDRLRRLWNVMCSRILPMLTPFVHQQLLVLTSSANAQGVPPCIDPALHKFEFYGPGDETLGQHLERVCREISDKCPAKGCDKPMLGHIRTYVHNDMRVQVFTERFVCPIPGEEEELLCWSYCKVCEAATQVARVSEESWSLSFAKYLELQFYPNHAYHTVQCGHNYYCDSVRYFTYQNVAVRFHADPVHPWEVMVPPLRLVWNAEMQCRIKNDEAVSLLRKSERFWDSLTLRVRELQKTCALYAPDAESDTAAILATIMTHVQQDRHTVRRRLRQVYWDSPAAALLPLNDVRRVLLNKSVEWDALFLDYERQLVPSEKEIRRLTASHLKKLFAEREEERESAACLESWGVESIAAEHDPTVKRAEEPREIIDSGQMTPRELEEPDTQETTVLAMSVSELADLTAEKHADEAEELKRHSAPPERTIDLSAIETPVRTSTPSSISRRVTNHRGEPMIVPEVPIYRERPESVRNTQVSSLARQFDRISREAAEREREREMQLQMMRTRRARPVTTTHATVEVFKSLHDAVGGDESDSDDEWRPKTDTAPPASPVSPASQDTPTDVTSEYADVDGHAAAVADSAASETESSAAQDAESEVRLGLFKSLAASWTPGIPDLAPLEYPFPATDHVFSDSRIVVSEDEPSSIIAFTLASRSYVDQLKASQQAHGNYDSPAAWERELRHGEATHYRYEFETESLQLSCKIFFAEQFDALRRVCGCGEAIVESLARSVKWDSSGGKSGSMFLKTCDDRLVVKQLSRAEMDGFSKFAPHYFVYLADCFAHSRPTTLAKILGCFRIGFRNTQTGRALKMDVVVMENLFYGRSFSRIFDLKGSTRNRFATETGRPSDVLLDENLLQMSQKAPVYVREHAKRILRSALYNDSLFLTDMNVMDYSLVVGFDETQNEMVIGIIDFVRTYTWDKRVESFVKETAILGGGGRGEPTIITPRQYRLRFLGFLDKVFLLTPDAWIQGGWVQ
ncbi:1-phosphatidylinositol-3-phosphate 5-kinase [Malassezia cuniculi]|uniref:1-phosphatidylinositol-3-phosphate 5-kinase n=1 Tax=Malassezia cuniculi TaxID=948313 RepID=A0AAF0J6P3_9BASI|nr:1-phosphatidylinositol-3-phosphate 5-kinase [Malassezia cuniculi]